MPNSGLAVAQPRVMLQQRLVEQPLGAVVDCGW